MNENAISAPILVVNTGSSSLKLGVYSSAQEDVCLELDGLADGIGKDGSSLTLRGADGKTLRTEKLTLKTEADALRVASEWMGEFVKQKPVAVGHRVVHGGPKLTEHQRITPEVEKELEACVHFAPLHIPVALELIRATEQMYSGVAQFACFDTAFHETMPEVAKRLPLPATLYDAGVRRYGFHGLSYESLVRKVGKDLPGRVVLAHLGSGASLCAVRDGKSVDTTMGLTPTGGVPMGTRSGDLDPGVLLYLMRERGLGADALEKLLNHDSGLSGLSGGQADMRDLLEAEARGDARAALAVEAFCSGVAKAVAGYATVLGGLDLLVFSGGIGEHSAPVRAKVCSRLGFVGVELDGAANNGHSETVSGPASRVEVRVVATEEDAQIARHCRELMVR